jgi:two-component system phosphate regulon sensor histidine kinase PhoR
MDRRTFFLIVILTALSLLGIIFIQFFWIRNALQLQEEQFDKSVLLGLKSVVNELYECKNDTCDEGMFCAMECNHRKEEKHIVINRAKLDSLVRAEFKYMGLKEPYVYGIFNASTQHISMISDPARKKELASTPHAASLSCIYHTSTAQLGVWFPDESQRALSNILWWLILCFLLIGILVFGFSYTIYSFLRQKKLSEMKSDFVNNMTHEFKTPIATISLASEMLQKPSILASEEKARKYTSIIYDENQRLRNQVEHILQIAVLDREQFKLRKDDTDVHVVIEELVEQFNLLVKEKAGKISLRLNASLSLVEADPMHLRNMVSNLLDNANKYSPGKPDILIQTENTGSGILVSVEDKGIGISHENQKHVFKKLYRVPTGNVHDVKGFGLGLYYVKTMAEAHGGWVNVRSEPNKGSRFEFYLPFRSTNNNHHGKNGV